MTAERDQELRELIALAAIGALDAGERAALDRELDGRPDLQADLADLEGVAAALADATAEAPPERLRANVLDAIRDVPQLPGTDAAPATPPADVVSLASRRRRWSPLAAAAAVVMLVAGGLAVRSLTADDEVDLAAVVEDDEAVTYEMDGTIPTMRLIHSSAYGAMALVGEDVPMPEGDQVYELWQIADGEPQRMDIFRPTDDGSVEMLVLDWDAAADAVFAITIEPAGGTDAPTGDIVAATA